MDIIDFVKSHLGEFKEKGSEIILKNCPFCEGGKHNDKYTFSINKDKNTYHCMRGKCSEKGHFNQLLKKYNENPIVDEEYKKRINPKMKKQYKSPHLITEELKQNAIDYAGKRKISLDTLNAFEVKQKDNNYIFNYKDLNGEVVFVKYRPIGKITDSQKKSWREKDTMPILYNMDKVDPNKPVVITEGEFDAMAIYEAGYHNVVSVPSGSKDFEWIENCWEWLEQVKEFILYGDNDKPGQEMIENLVQKLGEEKTKVAIHDYKDANEELFHDKENNKILQNIEDAINQMPPGIIRVAEIIDDCNEETVPTGFEALDKILEETKLGELTVWTGKSSSGKSTILGQVILSAIENDKSVFCYSGELTKRRFREWIDTQAAGSENLKKTFNKFGEPVFKVDEKISEKIHAWYYNKLFLYDNNFIGKITDSEEQSFIIEKCKLAVRKFNCQIIIIDNLMTSDFKAKNNSDYYRAQSDFVGRLFSFAKTYNVHVHLVAHPKKTSGDIEKEDILGSGDIANRADNVISMKRLDFNDPKDEGINFDYDAVLSVLKNRNTGVLKDVYLSYSIPERKYYQLDKNGNKKETKSYSWGLVEPGMYEVSVSEDCPF